MFTVHIMFPFPRNVYFYALFVVLCMHVDVYVTKPMNYVICMKRQVNLGNECNKYTQVYFSTWTSKTGNCFSLLYIFIIIIFTFLSGFSITCRARKYGYVTCNWKFCITKFVLPYRVLNSHVLLVHETNNRVHEY